MDQHVSKDKLTIPIYLNTKIVFDMLATLEDGFSQVKSFQTSKESDKENNIGADLGAGNLFALFSVGVKGGHKTSKSDTQTVAEEKTHTPVSLFQKLKSILEDDNLINRDVDSISIGDFVEIQGDFSTNPVIDMLSALKELIVLAELFSDDKNNNRNNQSKRDKMLSDNRMKTQIDGLIDSLKADGKRDIICVSNNIKVVLPTEDKYFLNNNMNEITAGNYKLLGKVVQVYKDNGSISLLRNTMFSKLKLDQLNEFQGILKSPELQPFTGDEGLITSIEAPVIMIIPIAIYI